MPGRLRKGDIGMESLRHTGSLVVVGIEPRGQPRGDNHLDKKDDGMEEWLEKRAGPGQLLVEGVEEDDERKKNIRVNKGRCS